MSNKALDLFNPSCKDDGAKWYACEATASNKNPFIGCCKTNPCSISGCSVGSLAPVSFNGSAYDLVGNQLPEPSCDSASTFYTCVNIPKNDTTFFGCCKTSGKNPCTTTDKQCSTGDLTAAVLGNQNQQLGWSSNGTDSSDEGAAHSHTGVIVGASVGGVAALTIVAILVYCLLKKRRTRSRRGSASSLNAFPGPEKTSHRQSTISEGTNARTPAGGWSTSPSDHNEATTDSIYNSPKPPPFAAFGGQYQYQQIARTSNEPVEMPGDFATGGVSQRYSEFPAEANSQIRQPPVEMESPMISPYTSPRPSPRMPNSGPQADERPRTADTTYRVSMGRLGSPR